MVSQLVSSCVEVLEDDTDKLIAYRLLALVSIAENDEASARVWVKRILAINRNYQSDQLGDLPQFGELLDDERPDEPCMKRPECATPVYTGIGVLISYVTYLIVRTPPPDPLPTPPIPGEGH